MRLSGNIKNIDRLIIQEPSLDNCLLEKDSYNKPIFLEDGFCWRANCVILPKSDTKMSYNLLLGEKRLKEFVGIGDEGGLYLSTEVINRFTINRYVINSDSGIVQMGVNKSVQSLSLGFKGKWGKITEGLFADDIRFVYLSAVFDPRVVSKSDLMMFTVNAFNIKDSNIKDLCMNNDLKKIKRNKGDMFHAFRRKEQVR